MSALSDAHEVLFVHGKEGVELPGMHLLCEWPPDREEAVSGLIGSWFSVSCAAAAALPAPQHPRGVFSDELSCGTTAEI